MGPILGGCRYVKVSKVIESRCLPNYGIHEFEPRNSFNFAFTCSAVTHPFGSASRRCNSSSVSPVSGNVMLEIAGMYRPNIRPSGSRSSCGVAEAANRAANAASVMVVDICKFPWITFSVKTRQFYSTPRVFRRDVPKIRRAHASTLAGKALRPCLHGLLTWRPVVHFGFAFAEDQEQWAGDVDRRVRPDDHADDHHEGEQVDAFAAEQVQHGDH